MSEASKIDYAERVAAAESQTDKRRLDRSDSEETIVVEKCSLKEVE
jgi:hypothetical protein